MLTLLGQLKMSSHFILHFMSSSSYFRISHFIHGLQQIIPQIVWWPATYQTNGNLTAIIRPLAGCKRKKKDRKENQERKKIKYQG